MRYRVVHTTSYSSSQPVSIAHNKAWLEPRETPWQQLCRFDLRIVPSPSTRSRHQDAFGNPVWMFSFNEGYAHLDVTASSLVEVCTPDCVAAGESGMPWSAVGERLAALDDAAAVEAAAFRFPSPGVPWNDELRDWALPSFPEGRPVVDALQDLTRRIHEEFTYDSDATSVNTPLSEVFELRRGVCQDFAHVEIAALRSLGLAARYVSGYLRTHPPPGRPRLIGADASHAWISLWCGADGWVDADPTNNVFAGSEHITVAWGRDYFDVHPVAGVCVGGSGHRLDVSVDVERVDDTLAGRT